MKIFYVHTKFPLCD